MILSFNYGISQNYTVNDLGDTADSNPGNGTCSDANGNCTLRAAIEEANAGSADLIDFSVSGTIIPSSILPVILEGDLEINGGGNITLDASGFAYGLFIVNTDIIIRDFGIEGGSNQLSANNPFSF